jgi:hypothetical protein
MQGVQGENNFLSIPYSLFPIPYSLFPIPFPNDKGQRTNYLIHLRAHISEH